MKSVNEEILVVDDDDQFLALIQCFCEEAGIEYRGSTQWNDDAFNTLNEQGLLLLDLQMPDMDGLDILQQLAQKQYKGYIALTSGLEGAVLESALKFAAQHKLNITQKLKKPFSLKQFNELIERYRQSKERQEAPSSDEKPNQLSLEELTEAIEQDWFYPAYQPQLNIASGVTESVECLARLKHPEKGHIPPTDFIPSLESQDLITRFTVTIIKRALREVATIFGRGYEFGVGFNISALSLNQKFCETLVELVEQSGIPSRLITLEITESSALSVNSEAQFCLSKLRIKGFNLSIDDFGTGYSTIKQLDELPFNEIKLDRSFVSNLHSKDTTRAIVAATSLLARNLNYRFVGEGVESEEQLEFLRMHQCASVQGFLFSKPLTVMELSAFLYNEKTSDTNYFKSPEEFVKFSSPDQTVLFLRDSSESSQHFIDAFRYYVPSQFDEQELSTSLPDTSKYRQVVVCGNEAISSLRDLDINSATQQLFVIKEITTQKDLELGLDSGVTDVFEWSIFPHELLQRLNNAFRYSSQLRTQADQLESSTQVAMNAMQEASQYGGLLQFVKSVLHVKNRQQMLDSSTTYLNSQGYSVALQLRDGASKYTQLNAQSECPSMIEKIFDALAEQPKLYEFNNRLLCNTADVSLLFLKLPEDETQLGLLRDIAATIIDVLEEKWIELREHHLLENIAHKLVSVSSAISTTVELVKQESEATVGRISDQLYQSFNVIDLSEEQENYLMNLIREQLSEQSVEQKLMQLSSLVLELETLANSAVKEQSEDDALPSSETDTNDGDDIELF